MTSKNNRKPKIDRLEKVFDFIRGKGSEVANLMVGGGWRSIFDPPSGEWHGSELPDKYYLLKLLSAFLDCGVDRLIYLYAEHCVRHKNHYRLDAICLALWYYANYEREVLKLKDGPVVVYLGSCRHPITIFPCPRLSLTKESLSPKGLKKLLV